MDECYLRPLTPLRVKVGAGAAGGRTVAITRMLDRAVADANKDRFSVILHFILYFL